MRTIRNLLAKRPVGPAAMRRSHDDALVQNAGPARSLRSRVRVPVEAATCQPEAPQRLSGNGCRDDDKEGRGVCRDEVIGAPDAPPVGEASHGDGGVDGQDRPAN